MSKKSSIGIVGLLVIGALIITMTGTVLAQEETPPPEQKPFGWHSRGHGFGHAMGRGFGGQVGLEAAAEELGMTPDELSTQLWGGKTMADLAEEAGVALEDVQDVVNEAHKAAMRDAIDQAEANGDLSSEHAEWLREGLDKGFLGGRGFGGCHGGLRGRGGFRGLPGSDTGSGIFNRFRRAASDA